MLTLMENRVILLVPRASGGQIVVSRVRASQRDSSCGNAMMLSKQCLKLVEIFDESIGNAKKVAEFDLD